jgi:EPS-associated MarR family transcriptional regulator
LAQNLGISLADLNYCLNALIGKGFLKVSNFHKSKNKFKYVHLLTPQGFAEKVFMTSRFLKRKMDELNEL